MNEKNVLATLLIALLLGAHSMVLYAQSDREIKTKQSELKKEYTDIQEKNQIIRVAAQDKPRPSTGRRRTSATTGYDYSQVKGFQLRGFEERVDKLFTRGNDLGLYDDEFRPNGTFPVPGRKGLGSSQTRRIEIYYVEATPEEQEQFGLDPHDILEIRIEKLETLPPAETGTEGGDETNFALGIGGSGGDQVAKGFSLAGADLRTLIKLEDEALWEDILARRSQESPIALPPDLFLPDKRGPFIVMTDHELETSTSRFADFWYYKDTLTTALLPQTSEAAGPFTTALIPILYPEENKIRVRNPNPNPIKLSDATFLGENASQFIIKTKLPKMLDGKGGGEDKVDIIFDYIGTSPHEVKTQVLVESKEARLQQIVDIVANPGRFPSDFAIVDASLHRIELRSPARSDFAPDWKLTYSMGNDEVGLPRWTSGISSLSVGYKHDMSIGLVLPMNLYAADLPSPLAFQKGYLSSPTGYSVNFDFTFGFPFALGGNLVVSNKFDGDDQYKHIRLLTSQPVIPDQTDYNNTFFHISTIAQLYYPIMFKDRPENPNVAFRLHIGGAFMQVQRAYVVEPGVTQKDGRTFTAADEGKMFTLGREKDVFDIYFRISFINLSAKNTYGIGVQYFNGRMMSDAWLELTNWLRVEMKYTFLLRDKEIWEMDSSNFMLTPRFRLGLPSIFN